MIVLEDKRAGIDRRKHRVKLPRAFERRRVPDPRKQALVREKMSAADQEVQETYWGA